MNNLIGENIRRLREARKMSKAELAERTGLSRASITKYEDGSRKPKIDAISRIAGSLGVSAATLYHHEKDPHPGAAYYGAVHEDRCEEYGKDVYYRAGNYLRSEASENCRTVVMTTLKMDGFRE